MNYAVARAYMVENQVSANRVHDARVIDALGTVPREVFVPDPMRKSAYLDENLPLEGGYTLIAPMVLGRLLSEAAIESCDTVLCVGDPTGYGAAVMAGLAQTVVALVPSPEWAGYANTAILSQDIDNVAVVRGDTLDGLPNQAPYDVIVFCGAIADVSASVLSQLAEGGRLVAVIRKPGAPIGQAVLVLRTGTGWSRRELFDAGTNLLPEVKVADSFVF